MSGFAFSGRSHRRFNPLTREWVLVSPQRLERPWQGRVEPLPPQAPAYDPECYLCPGNARAGGAHNPHYERTFVFENDFPALVPNAAEGQARPFEQQLLRAESAPGRCRVVSFSPRHDLTLARMSVPDVRFVVDLWVAQFLELSALPDIRHVQIFENQGIFMGCSNPHPHGQIWATSHLPNEIAKEQVALEEYSRAGSCLLCDYLRLEESSAERLVCANEHFVVIVPFWAVWPFETLLLSRRHVSSLDDLIEPERDSLAAILKLVTTRYDNLFETSFPYSMGFHHGPADHRAHSAWHLHAHYYPPLLRSATVRKFLVGYEMLASPQRDFAPESAAERLRGLADKHYLERA